MHDDDDVMSKQIILKEDIKEILQDELWTQYMNGVFHTWLAKLLNLVKI
jgi:hypothetical protein